MAELDSHSPPQAAPTAADLTTAATPPMPQTMLGRTAQAVGGRALQRRLIQRQERRGTDAGQAGTRDAQAAPPTPAEIAPRVQAAVRDGHFIERETGAFFLLNGLSPADLVATIQRLPAATRAQLTAHIDLAAQGYDRPRLEAALGASASSRTTATGMVGAVDDVRGNIGGQDFAAAFTRLAAFPAARLNIVLLGMDLAQTTALEQHLDAAPEAHRARLRAALAARHLQAVANQVTEAIARNDFIGENTGAFVILNGLNPTDITAVIQRVGKDARATLLRELSQAGRTVDVTRLTVALRQVTGGEATAAESVSTLDAIRDAARSGGFTALMGRLAAMNRPQLTRVLGGLEAAELRQLQPHVTDAPAEAQQRITDVLDDLLGATPMSPTADVIDLQGLRGLDRQMAELYNRRGALIASHATALSVQPDVAAGIMQAEAGGQTFGEATNRPIARFEVHVFWDRWGHAHADRFNAHFNFQREGQRWHDHVWREGERGEFRAFHGDQTAEWRVIEFAATLASRELAYQSASFGAGQTMGFNHDRVGAASAVEMVEQYSRSERAQVAGIFNFIQNTPGMTAAVQRGDYVTLARNYNGGGQAEAYAANIRNNAAAYRRVLARRVPVGQPAAAPQP